MVYTIGKIIILPIIDLWVDKVNGLKNIPKNDSFIIAANHASYMDHLIIVSTFVKQLDRKVHFLSKKEHFDNPLKATWHNYAGAIPLDREKGGKGAIRLAIKFLINGKIIAIHPEGTRSLTGKLQRAKTGVARLALSARVPVIPVGLIGTFEILPKGKYIPKLQRAIVNIGRPMYFNKYYDKSMTKKLLRQITKKIMNEIAALSKQKYNFD